MKQQLHQPEKTTISMGWKIFMISGILIYFAAMVFVAYLDIWTKEKPEFTSLSEMIIILAVCITPLIMAFKRKNMKW